MGVLTIFLDIFFAPQCIACKQEGKYLCDVCTRISVPKLVPRGKNVYFFTYLDEVWVQTAIHLLKYRGITSVFDHFLRERTQVIRTWFGGHSWYYIPVPASKKRLKKRGYNQAEILAGKMASFWGGSVLPHFLKKYERKSLVGRTRVERLAQASSQFYWGKEKLPAADFYIVVDDVLTTGSTLHACMELVRQHTKRPVIGLVIAHER